MTQQEIEASIARHQNWLEEHDQRMVAIDVRLDRVAEQQEANMQQIALLTESLMQLGSIVANYVQRGNQ